MALGEINLVYALTQPCPAYGSYMKPKSYDHSCFSLGTHLILVKSLQLQANNMEVKEALSDSEILDCWNTVVVLRPHLKKEEFLPRVRTQQAEGYHLLYIRNPDSGIVGSILGYRVLNFLWSGKTMYIDDVCSLPTERGRGYAGALLDHAKKLAVEMDLDNIGLDSGYTRLDAHRLYLNKGFVMNSHHFCIPDVKALKGKV